MLTNTNSFDCKLYAMSLEMLCNATATSSCTSPCFYRRSGSLQICFQNQFLRTVRAAPYLLSKLISAESPGCSKFAFKISLCGRSGLFQICFQKQCLRTVWAVPYLLSKSVSADGPGCSKVPLKISLCGRSGLLHICSQNQSLRTVRAVPNWLSKAISADGPGCSVFAIKISLCGRSLCKYQHRVVGPLGTPVGCHALP